MNTLVNRLLAIAVLAVLVSCGSPSQPAVVPVITFSSTTQVHRQRENVSATVRPVLDRKEFLQIWVRADDNQWYPCAAAKLDSASGAWNAICQFGSDKHPAAEGAKFLLGAFYTVARVNVEYLPDSVWSLLKNQQTAPVIFSQGK
jgi:hypothetical protein